MALVTRYQPWPIGPDFFNEVSRLFERAHSSNDASTSAVADWSPAVDIEEYGDKFVLYADVPGVDPASIEVTLEKGVLTLSGSRAEAVEQKGVERRRSERASGRFHRRFALPDTVDAESVSASGKNGVLEVVIPKRAQTQPRRITVNG
jgi:HSP20 family protein